MGARSIALTLHEIHFGPKTAAETKYLVESGNLNIYSVLITDSMSLYSALAMITTRVPQEKSLAIYIFWLKEMLTT